MINVYYEININHTQLLSKQQPYDLNLSFYIHLHRIPKFNIKH